MTFLILKLARTFIVCPVKTAVIPARLIDLMDFYIIKHGNISPYYIWWDVGIDKAIYISYIQTSVIQTFYNIFITLSFLILCQIKLLQRQIFRVNV